LSEVTKENQMALNLVRIWTECLPNMELERFYTKTKCRLCIYSVNNHIFKKDKFTIHQHPLVF